MPAPIKPIRSAPVMSVERDSFIVPATFATIRALRAVMPYGLISRFGFRQNSPSFFFVDVWVLTHLAMGIGAWLVISCLSTKALIYTLLGYGAIRVLELTVYNIDVMLGDPQTAEPYKLRSLRRSLILGLVNYTEVLFWFASFYRFSAEHFAQNSKLVSSLTGSFYFSILTMSTYGDITPDTEPMRWLVAGHLALSLFLTLGVLARFVSILPRPRSLDASENGN